MSDEPRRAPTVAAIMSRALVVVDHQDTVRRALELLHRHDIRHLPVVEGGRLVGVVSDRDLLCYRAPVELREPGAVAAFDALLDGRVAAVMRPNVETVAPGESVDRVIDLLIDLRIGAVPVVDGERLVGIVSAIDVLEIVRQGRLG